MNNKEKSAIELYREQWKPDDEWVAVCRRELDKANQLGNHAAVLGWSCYLFDALRPPCNLPIKNITTSPLIDG